MRPADIADLLKGLAVDVREYIAPVLQKQADMEQRIASLPTTAIKGDPGAAGPSAYDIAVHNGFGGTEAEWLASLRGPSGESVKGSDGASVTIDDVRPLIEEAVWALPKPKDGASVTVADVQPMLQDLVAALPVPKDGTSITLADVAPLIQEAVAAIPKPKDGADGKGITADDVQPMLRELIAELPVPQDGKDGASVTLADVRPLIEEAITKALPRDESDEKLSAFAAAVIERFAGADD